MEKIKKFHLQLHTTRGISQYVLISSFSLKNKENKKRRPSVIGKNIA